jgi:hypothetical protein
MRIFWLLIYVLVSCHLLAQTPGGVSGCIKWVYPSKDLIATDSAINNNRVNTFGLTDQTSVYIADSILQKGLTFFTVSLTDSLKERVLWSMGNDSSTQVMMTTGRMAGLDEFKYINFQGALSAKPQIHTFSRKLTLSDSSTFSSRFQMGLKSDSNTPVYDFIGLLPEYIIFNRVLPYKERMRVESYLALKYGISLNQTYPASYLNSASGIIWDASKYSGYSNCIAGIGRDDASALMQLKSGSTETLGLLEIESSSLSDNEFLIWGDNKGALKFDYERGLGNKLLRHWVASVNGDFSTSKTSLTFSTGYIQEMNPLPEDEIYWLIVDDSGTGTFPIGETRYFADVSTTDKFMQFADISWDLDSSGCDLFTFQTASEMFAAFNLVQPTCSTDHQGSISAEIVGGTAPFTVQLLCDDQVISMQDTEERVLSFTGLDQGTYALIVYDELKNSFNEEFLLANSDMEQVPEFESVQITEGGSLTVDGSEGISSPVNYSYSWEKADGQEISGSLLTVDSPGVYVLTVCNSEGCTTQRELNVSTQESDYFSQVEFYPNPTSTGYVNVRVQLSQAGSFEVSILSQTGSMVSRSQMSGTDYYSFNCSFPENGMWFISLDKEGSHKTIKILVNKK